MQFRPLPAYFISDHSLKFAETLFFKETINGGRRRLKCSQFEAAPDPVGVVL